MSSAYERHCRRWQVIRLKYGKGYSTSEIAEELGWSVETIRSDLQRIRAETAKLGEPEQIREHVLTTLRTLIAHEYEDLHRADREGDERSKHRAKSSMRQTLELLKDVHDEVAGEATPESGEPLSSEARDVLADVAEGEVEGLLRG